MTIGFMLMVGLIGGGIAGLATSGLTNRNTLEVVRNREYAADGKIEEAISLVRSSDPPCDSAVHTLPGDTTNMNDVAVKVEWQFACGSVFASDLTTPVAQRNVIFSAFCKNPTDAKCNFPDVIIRAQVNFQPAPGKTVVQSWIVNR